ncbi:MAG TPA: MFS transporter [Planctomycetaceae bacterium]|nr:MFS transporter [Planctomycetaceae bacterium]
MSAVLPPSDRRSFWALNITQFLGAFNDNLFKQLVLLVAVKLAVDNRENNLQGVAMFVFSLPFVLLSGVCGVLSDRISKRTIIVSCKVLEIVIMLLGMAAFLSGSLTALMVVLFFMGAHSAYFGPAKYGILPELFRPDELPRVNGWMLMMTFLSIILGVALAGQLMTLFGDQLWLGSLACVSLAVIGTISSVFIRPTPVANPNVRFSASALFAPPETRRLLARNRPLLTVLLVTSVFWCVGGIYQQGVNDLGILQLRITEASTGLLGACAAIGIAVGCAVSGRLSRGRFAAELVLCGMWGMIVSLSLLALPGPFAGGTLLGVVGSGAVLILVGTSAGLFAVPLQVYLQAMSPPDQKGQIIGTMNVFNWIGILLSAVVHRGVSFGLAKADLPPNLIFLAAVVPLLLLAVLYHPTSQPLSGDQEPTDAVIEPQQ